MERQTQTGSAGHAIHVPVAGVTASASHRRDGPLAGTAAIAGTAPTPGRWSPAAACPHHVRSRCRCRSRLGCRSRPGGDRGIGADRGSGAVAPHGPPTGRLDGPVAASCHGRGLRSKNMRDRPLVAYPAAPAARHHRPRREEVRPRQSQAAQSSAARPRRSRTAPAPSQASTPRGGARLPLREPYRPRCQDLPSVATDGAYTIST